MPPRPLKIFISAAEVSGDHHAARLIRQFARDGKSVTCIGLGGPKMVEAGCYLYENLISRSAMLAEAIGQVVFYWKLLGRVKKILSQEKPDLVITVDSPAWNIHVAKVAHRLGIPVIQYAAPQLWAWAPWRAGKWRKNTDRIASILPFEPEWFARKGIKATFVGHPLFDDRPEYIRPEKEVDHESGDDTTAYTVALLPGSRKHEVEKLWPGMIKIAEQLRRQFSDISFISAVANTEVEKFLTDSIPDEIKIEFCSQGLVEATARADLAIIASGTATLETAVAGCPMIVLYHVPSWQWHLVGKLLLTVKYISLVNILADKELVPEYVPFNNRVQEVNETASALLNNPGKLERIRHELLALTREISENKASVNVAGMVYELLDLD